MDRSQKSDAGSIRTKEYVDEITDDEIDTLVQVILESSTRAFAINKKEQPDSLDEQNMKSSDLLLQQIKRYVEYHRQQSIKMTENIRKMTESPFEKMENLLGPTYKIQKEMERVTRRFGAFTTLDKIADSLDPSIIGASRHLQNPAFPDAISASKLKLLGNFDTLYNAQENAIRMGLIGNEIMSAAHLAQEHIKASKVLNNRFHLGIDPAIFGATDSFQKINIAQNGAVEKMLTELARPSAINGALLAMQGLAPKGVIASVLKQHASPIDLNNAQNFKNTFEGMTSIDEAVFDDEALTEAIVKTHDSLRDQGDRPVDLVYTMFLLTLLMALMTARMWHLAEISHDSDQKQLEIAKAGATSEDIEKVIEAVEKSSSEISNNITAQAENDRHLRYVHNDVRLRLEANVDAMVIRYIYPDQLVRVIEAKGYWAKVEVINYRTEKPERGWVPRNVLRHRSQ